MKTVATLLSVLLLTSCALLPAPRVSPPSVIDTPSIPVALGEDPIAAPQNGRKLVVGVYGCQDTSGQRKVTRTGSADFSSAVLQDCTPFLSTSIRSYPKHFRVLERGRIDDILKERTLAQSMLGEKTRDLLGSMLIADVLMLGQIVSYDRTTTQSAGGLAINAIGGASEMVSDTLTFSLRAVSTKSGEVLSDVLVRKSVESIQANGHILKIIGLDTYSLEYGGASNEPTAIALQQAIQLAVQSLTQKGMDAGWWID